MPGNHRYEVRFVTDIEDILKKMQEVVQKISQMRAELIIDAKTPGGIPFDQIFRQFGGNGGGANQGPNVSSSAGTTMSGGTIRDPFGRSTNTSFITADGPGDTRGPWQQPNYR